MISLPDLRTPYHRMPAEVLLTILVWGEARGEPDQGKLAVAEVVRNRVERPRWWGQDWHSVMLKPAQFSIFNPGDPSLNSLEDLFTGERQKRALEIWRSCARAAAFVFFAKEWRRHQTLCHGADHYHTASVKPYWSQERTSCAAIGNHIFFCLES